MADVANIVRELPLDEQPVLLNKLSGGPASDSYLLASGSRQLVLRIDKPLAKTIGLDREAELLVLEAVAVADIGPQPIWADAGRGLLLTEFLQGECWSMQQLQSETNVARLGRLLNRLHSLPSTGRVFDVSQWARHYADEIGDAGAALLADQVDDLYNQLSTDNVGRVLCHNDPTAMNVIDSGELRLIDWEYAGVGDPYFDLAVVTVHHELSETCIRQLLNAYLGSAVAADFRRLHTACDLYYRVYVLWLTLVELTGNASIEQRTKCRALRQRLEPGRL